MRGCLCLWYNLISSFINKADAYSYMPIRNLDNKVKNTCNITWFFSEGPSKNFFFLPLSKKGLLATTFALPQKNILFLSMQRDIVKTDVLGRGPYLQFLLLTKSRKRKSSSFYTKKGFSQHFSLLLTKTANIVHHQLVDDFTYFFSL